MVRSALRSRKNIQKKVADEAGIEMAMLFPEPEEILNDVIFDQMMMDG
jgi:hypothetical protein